MMGTMTTTTTTTRDETTDETTMHEDNDDIRKHCKKSLDWCSPAGELPANSPEMHSCSAQESKRVAPCTPNNGWKMTIFLKKVSLCHQKTIINASNRKKNVQSPCLKIWIVYPEFRFSGLYPNIWIFNLKLWATSMFNLYKYSFLPKNYLTLRSFYVIFKYRKLALQIRPNRHGFHKTMTFCR